MDRHFSLFISMKKIFTIFILCGITFVVHTASWAENSPQLVIRDHSSQKKIVEISIDYGETFTIRYIHSVDQSPVFEVFRVTKGDGLVLEETYFRMFGAGMGHWQGHGKLFQDGIRTRIKEINYKLGSFVLRIGSKGVDHTILFRDQEIHLSEIAAGHRVEVLIVDP